MSKFHKGTNGLSRVNCGGIAFVYCWDLAGIVYLSPRKDFSPYFGKEVGWILPGLCSSSPLETASALLPVAEEDHVACSQAWCCGCVVGHSW